MQTVTLDKLDATVSRLGFGAMRFPTKEDKTIDREKSFSMIDLAYKGGVNYYDTGYGYHNGESETFLGEALSRYPRESFYLADKLPIWYIKSEEDTEKYFNEQLERCQVDYFDFFLIHALDAERWATTVENKVYESLIEKKAEGKIRRLGFSYHGDLDTFVKILDARSWDFVQIQINYLDYVMSDSKAYYDALCQRNIPCVVMEPVRGGFLSNLPESALAEMTGFDGSKCSPSRWALRWCMDKDNMPIILSGMSSLEQVEENLETFAQGGKLTPEESAMLDRVAEKIQKIKSIPCTACGYCMDCAFGVDIPGCFRVYNHYKLFNSAFRTSVDYKDLGEEHQAHNCTECGACSPMCPQGIAIPQRLEEVKEAIAAIKIG